VIGYLISSETNIISNIYKFVFMFILQKAENVSTVGLHLHPYGDGMERVTICVMLAVFITK